MKKIMTILLSFIMLQGLLPAAVPAAASLTTYEVSPSGSDANLGTTAEPLSPADECEMQNEDEAESITHAIRLADSTEETNGVLQNVADADREIKETVQLIAEDFETGTPGNRLHNWNGWQFITTAATDSEITIKQDPVTQNQYASVLRTRASDGSSVLLYAFKAFDKTLTSGIVSLAFKLKLANENGNLFYLYFTAPNASGLTRASGVQLSFNFPNRKVNGCSFPAPTGEEPWYDFEFVIDLDGKTIQGFLDGEPMAGAEWALTNNTLNGFAIGSDRKSGSLGPNGEFLIDDLYSYLIGDLDVLEVKRTEDGNLQTAEILFNNNVNETSLFNGLSLNGGEIAVSSVEKIDESKKHYKVTFAEPLKPETVYDLTLNGVSDLYGGTLSNKTVSFETRERRFALGDIAFYADYGSSAEEAMAALADGRVTAAFDIVNERQAPVNAALIMLHKRGDAIIDAKVVDATVPEETTASKNVALTVSNVTADDRIEAYLWDGFNTMRALTAAKIIHTGGVESIELASEAIEAVSLHATISGVGVSQGDMTLAGRAEPAKRGTVTALVLKPGMTLDSLTIENFKENVDFIGQALTASDGSYSFTYSFTGAANGDTYNTYVGGNHVNIVAADSVVFYGSAFFDEIVEKVNAATSEELAAMLEEKDPVPVLLDVLLNTVVKADLSQYYALNDYTTTENYKTAVCSNLAKVTFTDLEDIRTKLNEEILKQAENQRAYLALLEKINSAVWSELEQILTDHDEMIQTDWDGSYAKIKDRDDLKVKLYKTLAQKTFDDFDVLRKAFVQESARLVPTAAATSSSGGGGGGIKISSTAGGITPPTPIATESDTAEKGAEFDDLESVPWAKQAIDVLAAANIIAGVGNSSFAPNGKVTREQFVKMVVLGFGLYDETAEEEASRFIDISFNTWYEPYVASAVKCGIICGIDETHFGVGKELSRAEMATILHNVYRYLKKEPQAAEAEEYNDRAEIPAYAYESVMEMTKAGIMSGVGDNTFAPREKATRAMAAKVIWLLRGER